MAETYCGRHCSDCDHRLTTSCPGCRVGPGRAFGGECELARCCREKGHESCETCSYQGNCGTLRQRDSLVEYRCRKQDRDQESIRLRQRKAAFFAPWVNRLFWLVIFANVVSLICSEPVLKLVPALKVPGQLLNLVFNVGYCVILLKMASEEPRFRTSAWCILAAAVVNLVFLVIFGLEELPLLISLPLIAVGLVGEYNELYGFGDILSGVDISLSDKWYNLWKWTIGCYGAMAGSILVMLILPLLAVVLVIASVIAIAVLAVFQIIYIYRTAKALQTYAA